MSQETTSPGSNERLNEIVARYYLAMEQGQAIDRAELINAHPDLREELQAFFLDLDQVGNALRDPFTLTPPVAVRSGERQAGSTFLRSPAVERRVKYFGEFEILGELGTGGMGVVYKAKQSRLKKIVALKMIRSGQLASATVLQRFRDEARRAARLQHPNIVAVHEVGEHHEHQYYTMDYVSGTNLSELVKQNPLHAKRAAELVMEVATAVHYAHSQGVVHRDLKPANILLSDAGVPRITDFGLSKDLWECDETKEASLTHTGDVLGTAGYMSPEQARGLTRLVGPAADVYSLGAVLYALLTQRPPFAADTRVETIQQVIQREPISPRMLNPAVPRDLETICLKCLDKEPHKRYGSAELLAEDLKRFLDHRPVLARPISSPARAWRWCRRNPWIAGLSAAVAVSLLVGTMLSSSLAVIASSNYTESERQRKEVAAAKNVIQKSFDDLEKKELERAAALEEARWQLYRLRITRMEQLWREKDWGSLERLVAESLPAPGEKDLRGWEWHFLNAQVAKRFWRLNDRPDEKTVFDWDRITGRLAMLVPGKIEIWLPGERRLLKTLEIPDLNSRGVVTWAPDHHRLAVSANNMQVHVVDTATGRIECTLTEPESSSMDTRENYLTDIVWSPAGDCIGVTRAHKQIRLWKMESKPEPIALLQAEELAEPCRLHWVDKDVAVTTSLRGVMLHWRTEDWKQIRRQNLTPDFYHDAAWSPDGKHVALASARVVIADAAGTLVKELPDQGTWVERLCWIDNERLLTGNAAQELRIVHIHQAVPDRVYRLHTSAIHKICLGPDDYIASAGVGDVVKVWSPNEPASDYAALTGAKHFSKQGLGCAWHPTTNTLAIVTNDQGTTVAAIWSPTNAQPIPLPFVDGIQGVQWNARGDALTLELQTRQWKTFPWPLTTETISISYSPQGMGSLPAYSADRRFHIESTSNSSKTFEVVDAQSKVARTAIDTTGLYAYAWHPRAPRVAFNEYGYIHLIDPLRKPPTLASFGYSELLASAHCLAWSSDGNKLLAGSDSGVVYTFNGATLEPLALLRGHTGQVSAVAWSHDNLRIISAGRDGYIRWWDAARGIELFKMPVEGKASVCELRLSTDGKWLAARTETGMVHILTTEIPEPPIYLEDSLAPPTAEIQQSPSYEAYLRRARWYAVRQQWRAAHADYERAHQLSPQNRNTLALLANICLYLEDYPAYDKLCRTIASSFADPSPWGRLELMRALMLGPAGLVHLPEGWQSIVEGSLAQFPQDELNTRYRALVLYRTGKWTECIASVERELPDGPQWQYQELLWLFRAMALKQLGETEKAKQSLEELERRVKRRSFQYNKANPASRESQAVWFAEDTMYLQVAYREAVRLILNKRAELPVAPPVTPGERDRSGEFAEGLQDTLDKIIEIHPYEADAYKARAQWHRRHHRWTQAADDYAQYVLLNPDALWLRQDLAITSLAAGREEVYLEQCREIEKRLAALDRPDVLHTRAARILSLRPGAITAAEKLFESAAKVADQNSVWWTVHPQVPLLYRLERYNDALREARRIPDSGFYNQQRAPLKAWEAMILWQLDRKVEAREALTQSRQLIEVCRGTKGTKKGLNDEIIEAEIVLREAESLVASE